MNTIFSSALRTTAISLLVVIALVVAIRVGGLDAISLVSLLLRYVHVLAAIVWVGLIIFVNFIQHPALQEAKDRGPINRHIVRPVTTMFRHASHFVVVTGALMLVTSGYALGHWVYGVAVGVPPLRAALIWGGATAALVMWGIVHFGIWPCVRVILDPDAGDEPKAAARLRGRNFARINLILALPVTFAMIAAAHAY